MFRRLRARLDRLVALVLVLLGCGFCAALYVALRPLPDPSAAGEEVNVVASEKVSQLPSALTEEELRVLWAGRDPHQPPSTASAVPKKRDAASQPASSDAGAFTVRGIIYSTSGSSVAFIESRGKLGLYRTGQTLDGWTIVAIGRDSVSFGKDGRAHEVAMAHYAYSDRPRVARTARPASVRPRPTRPTPAKPTQVKAPGRRSRQAMGMAQPVRDVSGSTASTPRPLPPRARDADATVAIPQKVVEKARANPQAVMKGVNLSPILAKNGSMSGIALNKVGIGSLAARYGLAPGDRILAVNGRRIDSAARALQLYQRYRHSDSVMVTLERNGKRKNVLFYAR